MKCYGNLGSLTWAKRESEMKATGISTFLIVAGAPEANVAGIRQHAEYLSMTAPAFLRVNVKTGIS